MKATASNMTLWTTFVATRDGPVEVGVYRLGVYTVLTMTGRIGDLSEDQSKALAAFKSEIPQESVADDVSYNTSIGSIVC